MDSKRVYQIGFAALLVIGAISLCLVFNGEKVKEAPKAVKIKKKKKKKSDEKLV